jgi:hypothetical protein
VKIAGALPDKWMCVTVASAEKKEAINLGHCHTQPNINFWSISASFNISCGFFAAPDVALLSIKFPIYIEGHLNIQVTCSIIQYTHYLLGGLHPSYYLPFITSFCNSKTLDFFLKYVVHLVTPGL